MVAGVPAGAGAARGGRLNRALLRRRVAALGYGLGAVQAFTRMGDRWRIVRTSGRLSIGRQRPSTFLVLIYHRVHSGSPLFSIERSTPEAFRRQMTYLAREFHVLPLHDIVRRLRAGDPLPPRPVAVTFDDGYADNYTVAYPILRELGLPATIFLTSGAIGTEEPLWFDRILHAFEHTRRASLEWPMELNGLDDPLHRSRAAFDTLVALIRMPNQERIDGVARILEELGPPPSDPPSLMLDWDQVRTMSAGAITFGAHTATHSILTRQPVDEAALEIAGSKSAIETAIGRPVTLFAYPVGRRAHYSEPLIDRLRGLGFQAAFTTEVGPNGAGDDPFLLRRVKPLGEDVPSFALGLGAHYLAPWSASE